MIDEGQASLPELTKFILPSGGVAASSLHVARSVCRRAERSMVPLLEAGDLDANALGYVNRLSDWLFVAARIVAAASGEQEETHP